MNTCRRKTGPAIQSDEPRKIAGALFGATFHDDSILIKASNSLPLPSQLVLLLSSRSTSAFTQPLRLGYSALKGIVGRARSFSRIGEGWLLGMLQGLACAPYGHGRIHDRAAREGFLTILMIAADEQKPPARRGVPEISVGGVAEATVYAFATVWSEPAFDRAVHLARSNVGPLRNPNTGQPVCRGVVQMPRARPLKPRSASSDGR